MGNETNSKANNLLTQLIVFKMEDENYGLDIMLINSIERVSDITRVPHSQSYVLGVINLRGDIIPVINLRQRLGMGNRDYSDSTRIVIIQLQDYKVGMVVDSVKEVVSIPETHIQAGKDVFDDSKNQWICGVAKQQDDIILVLDLDRVLDAVE